MQQEIISLSNIQRFYKMGLETVKAVRDINLNIYKNEFVALMGPSGSGKSTLMNIIGCLDTPTSGIYKLNNKEVNQLDDKELALIRNKEIGFVFQTFNLLPRYNALENVTLPLIYSGISKVNRIKMGEEILFKVGLSDRMTHKPNELSGGQCQRVAIGRALINKPSIILADEPTGNLDSKMSNEIMFLFQQIHQEGNTVILVTHEQEIANYAHRIIKLKDGVVDSDEKNIDFIKANSEN